MLDCDLAVSEFEFHLRYYSHFRTNALWELYEPPYHFSYRSNNTATILLQGWCRYWLTQEGWYAIKKKKANLINTNDF